VIADIDPANGGALAGSEVDIFDDIFRDTFDMTEEEGTETNLYAEMNNTPKVAFREPGAETLSFEYMDTSPDRLKLFLGGEVNTVGQEKIWSKPANQGIIYKHVTITLLDGTIMVIPRAKVVGAKNFQFRRNNIWTLDVSLTPLTPEFPALAPMDIKEPTV